MLTHCHERGPSRERVTSSSFSGLRVVLFPHISRPLILLEDIVDDVYPQLVVDLFGLFLVRTLHSSVLLLRVREEMSVILGGEHILREVH